MLDMLADPEHTETMAEAAHQRAQERFAVEVVNAQMFEALGIGSR